MRHVLGAVVALSAVAGRAHGQSEDAKALAEQLFSQGREFAKSNRWEEACPKFEASLRYDPVLGTKLNLASCYEHVGKLASAWGLYRDLIELAKKTGDLKRASYAEKQVKVIEPRLPTLQISVPTELPAGFTIERDGTPLDPGAFGTALFVDPGTHKVVASAPGFESFTHSITLVEGKAETLSIPILVAKPSPLLLVEPSRPTTAHNAIGVQEQAAPPSPARTYIGLSVGAAGIVAVGAGLAFGWKANSNYKDAKKVCGADLLCDDMNDFEESSARYNDAKSSATIATVLVIAGGAAIVTGAVVVLTAPRAQERPTARLVPVPQDRGAGLAFVGRF